MKKVSYGKVIVKPLKDWLERGFVINKKSIYHYVSIDGQRNGTPDKFGRLNHHNNLGAITKNQVDLFFGKEVEVERHCVTENAIDYLIVKVMYDVGRVTLKVPVEMTDFDMKKFAKNNKRFASLNNPMLYDGEHFHVGCIAIPKDEMKEIIKWAQLRMRDKK